MDFITRSASRAGGKGSNPVFVTRRSKMQSERSILNRQLNKQMRLRAGAENLYNATSNVKVKETVSLELSFFNSNLQLLKEELSVLNSQITPYQSESSKMQGMAMISLGLKETKELDFTQPLKDFILEHYSEEPDNFEDEIADLIDLRNSIRTPARTDAGLNLLLEYYGQLYFVDHRFFPPDRQLNIHFHWYDSVTGIPSMQKSISLEKASVLFNLGALHSQIGTRADRGRMSGINDAVKAYESAAGVFNYLCQNFSHSPCADLSHAFVAVMTKLMLAQAQECIFEKNMLGGFEIELGKCISVAQEAAMVASRYQLVHTAMLVPPVSDTIPSSWSSMADLKAHHYKATSHYFTAIGLLHQIDIAEVDEISKLLSSFYLKSDSIQDIPSPQDVAKRKEDRGRLGRAHLTQAIFHHEKANSLLKMNRALQKVKTLQNFLTMTHTKTLDQKSSLPKRDETDLFDILDVPDILSLAEIEAEARPPIFTLVKVNDIFNSLGPLSVFSARQKISTPRPFNITHAADGWGFTLHGEGPVKVENVARRLRECGLKNGDVITAIDGVNVKWKTSTEVSDILDKHLLSNQKKDDHAFDRILDTYDHSQHTVIIKAITLISSEIPKTAGRMAPEMNGISGDAYYNGNGLSNGSNTMDYTSTGTLPVKRRLKINDGTKSLSAARSKQRHSMGFFQGLKMKWKSPQPSFSTPTENPYASTSTINKTPTGRYSWVAADYPSVAIPKVTPVSSTMTRGVRRAGVARSETFSGPSRPRPPSTRFTRGMDVGLY